MMKAALIFLIFFIFSNTFAQDKITLTGVTPQFNFIQLQNGGGLCSLPVKEETQNVNGCSSPDALEAVKEFVTIIQDIDCTLDPCNQLNKFKSEGEKNKNAELVSKQMGQFHKRMMKTALSELIQSSNINLLEIPLLNNMYSGDWDPKQGIGFNCGKKIEEILVDNEMKGSKSGPNVNLESLRQIACQGENKDESLQFCLNDMTINQMENQGKAFLDNKYDLKNPSTCIAQSEKIFFYGFPTPNEIQQNAGIIQAINEKFQGEGGSEVNAALLSEFFQRNPLFSQIYEASIAPTKKPNGTFDHSKITENLTSFQNDLTEYFRLAGEVNKANRPKEFEHARDKLNVFTQKMVRAKNVMLKESTQNKCEQIAAEFKKTLKFEFDKNNYFDEMKILGCFNKRTAAAECLGGLEMYCTNVSFNTNTEEEREKEKTKLVSNIKEMLDLYKNPNEKKPALMSIDTSTVQGSLAKLDNSVAEACKGFAAELKKKIAKEDTFNKCLTLKDATVESCQQKFVDTNETFVSKARTKYFNDNKNNGSNDQVKALKKMFSIDDDLVPTPDSEQVAKIIGQSSYNTEQAPCVDEMIQDYHDIQNENKRISMDNSSSSVDGGSSTGSSPTVNATDVPPTSVAPEVASSSGGGSTAPSTSSTQTTEIIPSTTQAAQLPQQDFTQYLNNPLVPPQDKQIATVERKLEEEIDNKEDVDKEITKLTEAAKMGNLNPEEQQDLKDLKAVNEDSKKEIARLSEELKSLKLAQATNPAPFQAPTSLAPQSDVFSGIGGGVLAPTTNNNFDNANVGSQNSNGNQAFENAPSAAQFPSTSGAPQNSASVEKALLERYNSLKSHDEAPAGVAENVVTTKYVVTNENLEKILEGKVNGASGVVDIQTEGNKVTSVKYECKEDKDKKQTCKYEIIKTEKVAKVKEKETKRRHNYLSTLRQKMIERSPASLKPVK